MELWIRSQDKELLTKVKHLEVYGSETEWWIMGNDNDLGTYKSKKRALEVLDEIQKILKPTFILKDNGGAYVSNDNDLHIIKPTYQEIKELTTYVYEMPKD